MKKFYWLCCYAFILISSCSEDNKLTKSNPSTNLSIDFLIESHNGKQIKFKNLSVGTEEFYWTSEGDEISKEKHPLYTFPDTGVYGVTLYKTSPNSSYLKKRNLYVGKIISGNDLWFELDSVPGNVRNTAASFVLGKNVYFGTGWTKPSLNGGTQFYKYDIDRDTFAEVASYPIAIINGIAYSLNGKGYVGGGHTPDGQPNLSFYSYDSTSNVWEVNSTFPTEVNFGKTFVVNSTTYLVRAEGRYPRSTYKFNPSLKKWTKIEDRFFNNSYQNLLGAYSINDKGYMVTKDSLYQFDPVSESWTKMSRIPEENAEFSSMGFVINNELYISAGERGETRYLFKYISSNNSWQKLSNPPLKVVEGISFSSDNSGFIGLGENFDFRDKKNQFWRYYPVE